MVDKANVFEESKMPLQAEDRNSVTLEDAVYWLAYSRSDSAEDAETNILEMLNRIKREIGGSPHIHDSYNKDAQLKLTECLHSEDIYAVGRFRNRSTSVNRELDYRLRFPDSNDDVLRSGEGQNIYGGDFSEIRPEHWDEGKIDWNGGKLVSHEWEFVDIRVPVCCLKLLKIKKDLSYSTDLQDFDMAPTPYIKLINEAVLHFWRGGLPPEDKKETIVEWLKDHAPGVAISDHMAGVMATMIRPPEAGIGGNKKMTRSGSIF